jgi:hypothetical protein
MRLTTLLYLIGLLFRSGFNIKRVKRFLALVRKYDSMEYDDSEKLV